MSYRSEAIRIDETFGKAIEESGKEPGSIPDWVIAGIVYNECGRNNDGSFNPDATRFEPGVYKHLIEIRDQGSTVVSGSRRSDYNRIVQADLQGATDASIKALSRSYGPTQIMGWSMVKMLHGTIAELADVSSHFRLCRERLKIVSQREFSLLNSESAFRDLEDAQIDAKVFAPEGLLGDVLRIWNTGKAKGTTFSPRYVPNGLRMMQEYRALMNSEEPGEVNAGIDAITAGHDIDDDAETATPVPTLVPTGVAVIEKAAPATSPAPSDDTIIAKAKQAGVKIKAWMVGIPGALLAFVSGMYKWATDPSNRLLVLSLIVIAGVIVTVFVVMNYWYSNQQRVREDERAKRDHELQLLRERQAHDLTVLQANSAADPNQATVKIV